MDKITSHAERQRPTLNSAMALSDLRTYYWLKSELVAFCMQLGVPATGKKLEILARIEHFLQTGQSQLPRTISSVERKNFRQGPPDSDQPLTLQTPVVHFRSDEKTRAFFTSVIGPQFHFIAHWSDFMQSKENVTYGDLVGEWLAEKERRKDKSYKPQIMKSCEYNQFIRDFFADEANHGKDLRTVITAWNEIKSQRGPRIYTPQKYPPVEGSR